MRVIDGEKLVEYVREIHSAYETIEEIESGRFDVKDGGEMNFGSELPTGMEFEFPYKVEDGCLVGPRVLNGYRKNWNVIITQDIDLAKLANGIFNAGRCSAFAQSGRKGYPMTTQNEELCKECGLSQGDGPHDLKINSHTFEPVAEEKCPCGVPLDSLNHIDMGPGFTHNGESKSKQTEGGPYNLIGDLYVMGPGLENKSRYGVAPDCLEAEHLNIAYSEGRSSRQAEIEKLVWALERYSHHEIGCATEDENICDCGALKALEALAEYEASK